MLESKHFIEEFDEYQEKSMKTKKDHSEGMFLSKQKADLLEGSVGLSGEVGEAVDHIKKHIFHGHKLDVDYLKKELGDMQWYLTLLTDALDLRLADVVTDNIDKLAKRYPNGFEESRSRVREKRIIVLEGMDCTFKTSVTEILTKVCEKAGISLKTIKGINEGSFEKNMTEAKKILQQVHEASEQIVILDRFHPISERYLNVSADNDMCYNIYNELHAFGIVSLFFLDIGDKDTYAHRLVNRDEDIEPQEKYTMKHFESIYGKLQMLYKHMECTVFDTRVLGSKEIAEKITELITQ